MVVSLYFACQCLDEIPRIQKGAAAGVDDHDAVAHVFDHVTVDQMMGLRRQRTVQADEIRRSEEFLQGEIAAAQCAEVDPHQSLDGEIPLADPVVSTVEAAVEGQHHSEGKLGDRVR